MVRQTYAECHAKGFTCWGQFVAVLFCQLGRAHSLQEITGGLRSCEGKLKHLGRSEGIYFSVDIRFLSVEVIRMYFRMN
jgi:hypothetical protein